MVALNLPRGVLWNTRTNIAYSISVPNRAAFLDAVANAVTKGVIEKYFTPVNK